MKSPLFPAAPAAFAALILAIAPTPVFCAAAAIPAQRGVVSDDVPAAVAARLRDLVQPRTMAAGVGRLVFVGAEPARIKGERSTGPEVAGAPKAYLVTQYRYADDTTIYTTIDAATNRVLARREARHVPTPITAEELAAARELALGDARVREALGADANKLTVEALGLYSEDRKDRIYGHRAMSLLFRKGALYRAGLEVIVDLTTRSVTVTRRAPNNEHR